MIRTFNVYTGVYKLSCLDATRGFSDMSGGPKPFSLEYFYSKVFNDF